MKTKQVDKTKKKINKNVLEAKNEITEVKNKENDRRLQQERNWSYEWQTEIE